MKSIELDFELSLRRFRAAESALSNALDVLAKARDAGHAPDVTKARLRAEAAERHAIALWETLERARVAYWRARSTEARAEIPSLVAPRLAQAVMCARYAGDQSALQHAIAHDLAAMPLPEFDLGTSIPWQPVESAALERADDEVF